ncbi:MAG: hypothetical protein QM662_01730 [Gordonia sp. (in: high G+C Gram-positive bacteria)]
MTIVYFVIAAVALIGAAVLLWLDHRRVSVTRHQRAVWGDDHDFKFRDSDTKLRKVFHRATMDVPDHVGVQHVAYGVYRDTEAIVFDLAETATVIAVRRSPASGVVVDLRHEEVLAPAEDDVELLGAMGQRVMFSNNLDAARRVCDRRMVALATKAPAYIEVLWNEGNWALGSLPLTNDPAELDTALEVVRRFADLLRVLPPLRDPQDAPDPRDPSGPVRAESAEQKTDGLRDGDRHARAEAGPVDDVPTTMTAAELRPRPRRAAPPPGRQPTTNGRPMRPMPVRGGRHGQVPDPREADPDLPPAEPRSARSGPSEMPERPRYRPE